MKKQLWALLFTLFMLPQAFAQAVLQSFPFTHSATKSNAVTTDAIGNVLVAGKFWQHPSGVQTNSPGIVLKYTPSGQLLWSGLVTGGAGTGVGLCTDNQGNVYVLGEYGPPFLQLGDLPPLIPVGNGEIFLAKYNFNGELQWAKPFAGMEPDVPAAITCDASGNIIICGYTESTSLTFSPSHTLLYGGGFVVKLDPDGNSLWLSGISGKPSAISTSPNQDIFLSGDFENEIFFGSSHLSGTSNSDAFLAKYSAAGIPQWAKAGTSGLNGGKCFGVSNDDLGNIYLAGRYQGNIAFDNLTLSTTNNRAGGYVVKYSASGTALWAKSFQSSLSADVAVTALKASGLGSVVFSGTYYGNVTIGNNTFTSGGQDIFLAKINESGNVTWAVAGGSQSNDTPRSLTIDAEDYCYVTGNSGNITGTTPAQTFTLGNYTSTEQGAFLHKAYAGPNATAMGGRIYYDLNSNGAKDTAEPFAPGIVVEVQPGQHYLSSSLMGQYIGFVNPGTYTIASQPTLPYYSFHPASYQVLLQNAGQIDTTGSFALRSIPNQQDLRIIATPLTAARPGFGYKILLTYRNVGTTLLNGSINLTHDPLLTYVSSTPAQGSYTGNTLSWNFADLQPLQQQSIIVSLQLPATAPLGESISSTTQVLPITADLTPQNNTTLVTSTITGSFDPNDKQVSYTSLTPDDVAQGRPLDYLIRFQNTGTDTAFTVRIIDTLSSQLNIPSLEVLSASHPYTWSIRGNGITEFRFDNILLPDSNTNEPASHGFIYYRITPKASLAVGDIVENTAYIYFDFNTAVITNTAATEVSLLSAVAQTHENLPLHVYPNPNNGKFTIELQKKDEQLLSAELCNMLGQTVWQTAKKTGDRHPVITSNLGSGIYFLHVQTNNGNAVQKVVIE